MFPFDLFAQFLVDRKFCIASVARIQLNCAPKCNSKLRGNDKKKEVDFDQVDVLLSILTSDSDHSSRFVPLMKKFKEWITPPNRVHSFFIISSPSTPFWEFINSLFHSIYNYCHYITTWSCMLSFEKTCLITKFLHSNCKC